jgi:pentatricopeptide repeat protein
VLYTTLIKAYSKRRELNKVLEIFNHMKRDKHNAPNNVTFNSVIDCCVKCEQLNLAEKILEEMHRSGVKPDIITFSTLIKGGMKKGDFEKALQYLDGMCKLEIRPDEVLLNSLLDGCEKLQEYNRAVDIFTKVRAMGVEPSMMSFSIMMKILGKLGDFETSMGLMQEVRKKNKNISLIIFTCYMKTCFSTGHFEEGLATYKQLKVYRLTADSITYATVLNGLIQSKSREKSSLIDKEIIEILDESLSRNIDLKEKIYFDIVKKFSGSDKALAQEVKQLLDSHDIKIKPGKYFNKPNPQSGQKKEGNLSFLINSYKHKNFNKRDKPVFTPNNENKSKAFPLQIREDNSASNLNTTSNISNSNKFFSKAQTDGKPVFSYPREGFSTASTNPKTPYNMDTSSEKENPRMKFHAINRSSFGHIAQVLTPLFNQFGTDVGSPSETSSSVKRDNQSTKTKKFNRF